MTFKDRFEFGAEWKNKFISMLPNKQFYSNEPKECLAFKDTFYRYFYTDEYGDMMEKLFFQALSDYFYRIKVPVILTTINHKSTLPFEFKINPKDYNLDSTYHPTRLGQNMLAKLFRTKINQCLNF